MTVEELLQKLVELAKLAKKGKGQYKIQLDKDREFPPELKKLLVTISKRLSGY